MKTQWASSWVILSAFTLLAMLGCTATGVRLPAVTEAPTGNHDTGRIIWRDLISNKPAESRRFYEELFGWEFESVGNLFNLGGGDVYSLIRHNGRLIGGMVNEARLQNEADDIAQWVVLMSVADVDAATATFASDGGEVLTPPTDVADRGRQAATRARDTVVDLRNAANEGIAAMRAEKADLLAEFGSDEALHTGPARAVQPRGRDGRGYRPRHGTTHD